MVLKVQGDVGRCVAINRRSAVNFVHAPHYSFAAEFENHRISCTHGYTVPSAMSKHPEESG